MTFAATSYAYFLFLLPVVALLKIWADARGRAAVRAFAESDRLRPSLLGGASSVWSGIHFGMQMLGLFFLIIALTRPQYGIEQQDIEQTGRSIFIAIDTSKSMLADDMSPNRLTRAKLAALDLLEKLPGDRVGLIAFAGRAFLQAPLTTDHDAVRESIQSLDHTTIPRGGSSLGQAIELAVQTIEKNANQQHGMVIFSDGQETDSATLEAAKKAAEKHLLILPVGVGTVDGSLIPDPEPDKKGDYIRDESGTVVRARLEWELLKKVADITGGQYTELATQALTKTLVDNLTAQLDRKKAESRQQTRPIERYQWPLFLAILLLTLSMMIRPSSRKLIRRVAALPVEPQTAVHQPPPLPISALIVALLILTSMGASAASIDDVKKAQDEYKDGRYETSKNDYSRLLNEKKLPADPGELAYGLGASTHKLKDYQHSIQAFSQALQSHDQNIKRQAFRGLATSLYEQGEVLMAKKPEDTIKSWTESRDDFDAALPYHDPASAEYMEIKENRDFVQKRLDELKKEQEQQKQKGKGKKDKNKDKKKGDEKGDGESNEKDDPSEDGQGENDKENQKEHDAMQKKEQQQQPGEGQIQSDQSAGKPQEPKDQGQQQPGDAKEAAEQERNKKTGFSPLEARAQLRNYADDQKSVQYLMKRERPMGGKDY